MVQLVELLFLSLSSPEDLIVDFREREKEKEKDINQFPLAGTPDQGPNVQPRHVP